MGSSLLNFFSRFTSKKQKWVSDAPIPALKIRVKTLVEQPGLSPADSQLFSFIEEYNQSSSRDDILQAYNEKSLKRVSPYSGNEVTVRHGVFLNKYHAYVFVSANQSRNQETLIEVLYTGEPFAIYNIKQRTLFLFRKHPYIQNINRVIHKLDVELQLYFESNCETDPVLFVGDTRPLHFFGDSVGYLYENTEQIQSFNQPLEIIQSDSQSFVDIASLFGPIISTTRLADDEINSFCRTRNLLLIDGHRPKGNSIIKRGEALKWAARRIADDLHEQKTPRQRTYSDALIAVISLDVEKDRFINQREFCALVIDRLLQVAEALDRTLVVAWDGWTLRDVLVSKKDKGVISRLDELSDSLASAWGAEVEFTKIYDISFEEKLAFCRDIDVFFSTFGTASMIPGGMARKPGFCYHNPIELTKDLPITYDNVIVLKSSDARFVDRHPEGKPQHHWSFTFNFGRIPKTEKLIELVEGKPSRTQ